MTDGTTTWTYTYDANGMRTSRSNGTTTYKYVYNGSSLVQMTVGSNTLYFTSDTVTLNGITYYYVKNLHGDIVAILNSSGTAVVQYTYDAWGKVLSITGSMASTLGTLNPLRYRGYVYDQETGLYYLRSRLSCSNAKKPEQFGTAQAFFFIFRRLPRDRPGGRHTCRPDSSDPLPRSLPFLLRLRISDGYCPRAT